MSDIVTASRLKVSIGIEQQQEVRLKTFLQRPEMRGWDATKFVDASITWMADQLAECNGDGSGYCYTHDAEGLTEDSESDEPQYCEGWGFPGAQRA